MNFFSDDIRFKFILTYEMNLYETYTVRMAYRNFTAYCKASGKEHLLEHWDIITNNLEDNKKLYERAVGYFLFSLSNVQLDSIYKNIKEG